MSCQAPGPPWHRLAMKPVLASIAALALANCASSTINGPSRLAGQELDAAVALYGPWVDEIQLDGRPLYIWRRALINKGTPYYCELRVQLGFRNIIRQAFLQGTPESCKLFAVRYEALTK